LLLIALVNLSTWLLREIQVELGYAMQSQLSSVLRTVFSTICFVIQCFCLGTRNFNCLSNTPDGRLGCKRRTRNGTPLGILVL
jgi:hypothetical protein